MTTLSERLASRARPSALLVSAVLVLAQLGAGTATAPSAAAAEPSSPGVVSTSFETADGLIPGFPVVTDPPATGVVGPGAGDDPGLELQIDNGPDTTYAAKADVGFTGLKALHYAGRHLPDGPAGSANQLMDIDQPVEADTVLEYLLFPDFDEHQRDYAGTEVTVDLLFTDGSRLSGLGVAGRTGVGVYPLQWNKISVPVGEAAAGRTIDRVLLAYTGPAGPAQIGGWVDDISIGPAERPERTRPSDWVVTTRGTQSSGGQYSRGNNFPATAVPNGFNFWTPQTDAGSLSEFYAYHSDNNEQNLPEIQAFAASHQPSIWMGDRQTFQVMPSVATDTPDADRSARALAFRHENETALPHHYGVAFDNGLVTDIAPTDHAALFRFTFPEIGGRQLIFDNVNNDAGLTIDAEAGVISGWSETRVISTGMTRMFLYATVDQPITGSGMLPDGQRPSTGYVSFDAENPDGRVVNLRMATSLISVEQARKNLEQEISADDTFESVAARAQQAWDDRLDVVELEGATDDQLTTMYSNLYRVFLYPNSAYENTGTVGAPRYQHAVQSSASWGPPPSTPTETGAEIADGKVFVNTGFWDTFRAAWPAYSLLAPEVGGELVDGFVQQYRDGGWISPWSSPGYARVMTGTSSDSAFADAYVKGVPGIDARDTYDAALKNATVRPPDNSIGRDQLDRSVFGGYVPNDTTAGFATSIDGAMNDFAIAKMAQAMAADPATPAADRGRLATEAEYLQLRSEGYADLFDPEAGFFQGRSVTGEVTTPAPDYDPEVWGNDHDYTEANGWNEAFPAPYDGQGLAELYGGRQQLADKLDEFFATTETASKPGSYGGLIHEMRETRDLRLGQWSIPNQVSHHIPWMYNFTQQPWKAQQQVRAALDRGWLGSEIGQGYPGDEDNGATSAWWVFSALGFYPLQLATGQYTIGSPLFDKATLHLPGGDLVIEAPGGADDIYVQSLTVDGQPHTSTAIDHAEIADGGVLTFTMGPEPSDWGTGVDDVPDSVTAVGDEPGQLHDVTGVGRGTVSAGPGQDVAPLFDDTSLTATQLDGFAPTVDYTVSGGDRTEVTFYTLTSGDGDAAHDPSRWVLEGSADGKHWQVLDRRSGEQFRWRGQTRPFKIDRPGNLPHYRIRFLGNRSDAGLSLAEIELLTPDQIPDAPLTVQVDDVTLRAGTSAAVAATITNTGEAPASPQVDVSAPDGWAVDPASVAIGTLAPGASTAIDITVTAPAAAAPGPVPLTVTAAWDGWTVVGNGMAQVVGDVMEMSPGTDAEQSWLVDDDGSALTGADDGQARYADGQSSFTYRLPLADGVAGGTVTLDIANEFEVAVSTDRQSWTTVLREEGKPIFQSNRAERQLDLGALREAIGGTGSPVYLRISDSHPEDGWGGWLAGIRLETTG